MSSDNGHPLRDGLPVQAPSPDGLGPQDDSAVAESHLPERTDND